MLWGNRRSAVAAGILPWVGNALGKANGKKLSKRLGLQWILLHRPQVWYARLPIRAESVYSPSISEAFQVLRRYSLQVNLPGLFVGFFLDDYWRPLWVENKTSFRAGEPSFDKVGIESFWGSRSKFIFVVWWLGNESVEFYCNRSLAIGGRPIADFIFDHREMGVKDLPPVFALSLQRHCCGGSWSTWWLLSLGDVEWRRFLKI